MRFAWKWITHPVESWYQSVSSSPLSYPQLELLSSFSHFPPLPRCHPCLKLSTLVNILCREQNERGTRAGAFFAADNACPGVTYPFESWYQSSSPLPSVPQKSAVLYPSSLNQSFPTVHVELASATGRESIVYGCLYSLGGKPSSAETTNQSL